MSRPLRVFADSNVLLSAALGPPNDFRFFWDIPGVDMLTSQYSIGEVSRHLKSPELRAKLWQLIYRSHLVPDGAKVVLPVDISMHEKDLPILQSAIEGQADILVSGDRNHFGQLYGHSISGVLIESPRMFKSRYSHLFQEQFRV